MLKKVLDQLKKETKTLLSDLGIKRQAGSVVGVDLGLRYFRAARVRPGTKEIPLKDTLVKELAELKNIARDMKIDAEEEVSINFKGEAVAIKRVGLPVMPKEEIEEALRWELKEEIPFGIDSARIKFKVLKEKEEEDGSKKIHLIAVVYKESDVETKVKELRNFGLNVQNVVPAEFALTSYVNSLNLVSPEETVAIVDIGSVETDISIIEDRKLSFARSISIGGDTITEAMTGVLVSDKGTIELSREEAEKVKHEQGIPEDIKLLSMMRPVLEKLSSQVKRSMEYYEHQFNCGPITKIILAGGGSKLKGLKEHLSKEIGVNVISELPEIAEALGLARVSGEGVNILPEKFRQEKKKRLKKISFRMLSVLFGCLFLVFYGFLLIKSINLQKELEVYRTHLDTLKDVELIKNKMLLFSKAIVTISSGNIEAGSIMRELSQIIPDSVVLESLNIKNSDPHIKLKGVILKEDELSSFMADLEHSAAFEHVKLVFSEESDLYNVGSLEFEIVANFSK